MATLLSRSQRKAMRTFVVDTTQDRNPPPRDRAHAQLLALVLIADSLEALTGQDT